MDILETMRKKMPIYESNISKDVTLVEFATYWLDYRANDVKKSTLCSYRSAVNNHIGRVFQSRKLSDISSEDVQLFSKSLSEGIGLTAPLSPKTVQNIHGVLHKCLQTAYEMKLIDENPAQHTTLPKTKRPEIIPMNNTQLLAFLTAIKSQPLETFFKLAVFTGLRKGELMGLTRDCLDFEEGCIHVYRQLSYDKLKRRYFFDTVKNGKPRIIYPADTIMEMMREHISHSPNSNFVFCTEIGEHLKISQIRKPFERAMSKIHLSDFRFHDLRHTFAVISIKAGVDLKTLSEQMGHHSVAFTLDTYAFALTDMKVEGAKKLQVYIDSLNIQI